MINGREFAWEEVSVVMEGKPTPIIGIQEINYTTEKEWKEIYGKGDEPVAISGGLKKFSGKLTLLQSEVEAMQIAITVTGKDLTNASPTTISVSYQSDIPGDPGRTDLLTYVRFGKIEKGMKTGDPNMACEIPLIIGKIIYGV